ncbi:arsenate reductase family protein [Cellulosilyticum ruminicola]|uniref:arsenate reductase family protein n=1 Tax=Cellulosilyticum ruminicola TaxID=425254 RepID=UPI0006D2B205|nr:arsenate reductase family protein [Cellulosilyticum ruminicola]
MAVLFLHYPKCTTCKHALKYLKDHDVNVKERHIVEENPTEEELKIWIAKSGLEFKKFFNTSGLIYKELGLKYKIKEMSMDEAVKLLATNGMLVKRPLLITEEQVLVGFKEPAYEAVLTSLK